MFWPRRFTIYILGDVIQLFLVMLIGLTSIIMLGIVLHFLLLNGLGTEAFAMMLPYASVVSLQFAVPSSLLFAVCTVYGRISADNEITAVKSVGVSPMHVINPTMVFALLMSPLAVWMIDSAVSWGLPGIQKVILHSIEETVYSALSKNRSYVAQSGFTIHVHEVEGRWLIRPTIQMHAAGAAPTEIHAERARLSRNAAQESLTIELEKYEITRGDKQFYDHGDDVLTLELPLFMATAKTQVEMKASMIPLRNIAASKRELVHDLVEHESQLLTRTSMALASGRLTWLQDPESQHHRDFAMAGEQRMQRLVAEPWRRWAQGFSCFCFVWVGIPLAIKLKSADYVATFGVCFLPILLLYYPLFGLGVDKAKQGDWHPASPWIANGLLLLVGAWWLRKVYRE